MSIILCERLKPYLSSIIGLYQCGFRPGKSTVDQMFTLRQILEKTHEFNVDMHHLFIDVTQARFKYSCEYSQYVCRIKSQMLSQSNKEKLYNTLIVPVLIYGDEA